MHRHRLAAPAMSLLVAVAGLTACGGDDAVHSLHGDVAPDSRLALFDTVQGAPYLFEVLALCSDAGADTTILGVHLDPPIQGSMTVTGWAVQDSDTIKPGDAMQPGGVRGTLSDYPKYGHGHVRNPCSDRSRVTDLIMQVERTSATTAGVPGLSVEYRTGRGRGTLRSSLQYALCVAPNTDRICRGLAPQ